MSVDNRVFAIFIFLVLRRFSVDLASIFFGNRRQLDANSTPTRRQIDAKSTPNRRQIDPKSTKSENRKHPIISDFQ